MTPDQYRREGFQAGIEAAAEACADYPRTAPDETEWTHYDEQIAHSQACIRAIDVDEALAGMPPTPDPVARLVKAARALADHGALQDREYLSADLNEKLDAVRAALAAVENQT